MDVNTSSLKKLGVLALLLGGLTACSDNDVARSEQIDENSFVGLMDRVFLQDENDEPVPVNDLTIEDDADENSFSSRLQGY